MDTNAILFITMPVTVDEAKHIGAGILEYQLNGMVLYEKKHTYAMVWGSKEDTKEFADAFPLLKKLT